MVPRIKFSFWHSAREWRTDLPLCPWHTC